MSEVGIRGNLHSDFVNTTRVHHGSTQATQNRPPKHLWGLSTNHLLWSYRSRDLDQRVCRAPPPWERKAALTAVSHSTGKGDAYGFGTGEGCFPHSKHRNGAGKFEKQRMGRHCFCLQNSSIFLLAVFHERLSMVQLPTESSKVPKVDACPKQTTEDQQRCLMQRNNTKKFAWMLKITNKSAQAIHKQIHEYNVCAESTDTTMKS